MLQHPAPDPALVGSSRSLLLPNIPGAGCRGSHDEHCDAQPAPSPPSTGPGGEIGRAPGEGGHTGGSEHPRAGRARQRCRRQRAPVARGLRQSWPCQAGRSCCGRAPGWRAQHGETSPVGPQTKQKQPQVRGANSPGRPCSGGARAGEPSASLWGSRDNRARFLAPPFLHKGLRRALRRGKAPRAALPKAWGKSPAASPGPATLGGRSPAPGQPQPLACRKQPRHKEPTCAAPWPRRRFLAVATGRGGSHQAQLRRCFP